MTSEDLTRQLADRLRCSDALARRAIQETCALIVAGTMKGKVVIRHFGTFRLARITGRKAVAPNGTPYEIKPGSRLVFKPAARAQVAVRGIKLGR